MNVTVRIPTILRSFTGGASEVRASGGTVADVLASLEEDYPGIGRRILTDTGALQRYVNVFVGSNDVRSLQALDTATPDGTQLTIIPAVAGGRD